MKKSACPCETSGSDTSILYAHDQLPMPCRTPIVLVSYLHIKQRPIRSIPCGFDSVFMLHDAKCRYNICFLFLFFYNHLPPKRLFFRNQYTICVKLCILTLWFNPIISRLSVSPAPESLILQAYSPIFRHRHTLILRLWSVPDRPYHGCVRGY